MKKFLFIVAIFILMGLTSYAQINFQFIVKRPLPVKFSKWQQDPSIIQLLLINSSPTPYEKFQISLTITDENGNRVAYTKDNHSRAKKFNINPGETKIISGPDLVNFKAVHYDKSIEDIIFTTNSLPEGNYLLCARIIDSLGNNIGIGGERCELISIFLPEPPTLISPYNRSTLINNLPQFVWTPVVGLDPSIQVEYRIKIAKIFQGQTPRTAIETNVPILDKYVRATSYQYLPSDINLSNYTDDFGFAWQVQAVDANTKEPVTKSDGKSEVWSFFNQNNVISRINLISPDNNSKFSSANGLFYFTWNLSEQMSPISGFKLKIVEVNQGQSAFQAMKNNQPVFAKNDIPPTVFSVYINDDNTVLLNRKKYAWQVYSLGFQGGNILDSSEIRTFTVKSSLIDDIDLVSPANNSIITLDSVRNVYNFKWSASQVQKPITNFILKIVPLLAGQTPEIAISNNFPVFNKNDIAPQESEFSIGKNQGVLTNQKYIWQVQAVSRMFNNQVVGESDIWVFEVNSAPTTIENISSFTIGSYKIDIKNITNNSMMNFSGVGEFNLWQGAPKLTVNFDKLQLANYGVNNNFDWRVVVGEIATPITPFVDTLEYNDPEIPTNPTAGSQYVKSSAFIEIKGIKFNPSSNLANAKISFKSPLIVRGGSPNLTIETLDSWFNVNPISKVDSGLTKSRDRIESQLLTPRNFTYELDQTSEFIVSRNKLELKLNGIVTLPDNLKDKDGKIIKIKFNNVKGFKFNSDLKDEQLYYPINSELWAKINKVNVDLYLGLISLIEGSITINTSSLRNFDAVNLDDKDSVYLNDRGLSCKIVRNEQNQQASNFRGFRFTVKNFQLEVKDNLLRSVSNLLGDVKIPFLNQNAELRLQITNSGIGNGVIDPQSLNEQWIEIFNDTKSGTKINLKPIGIAYSSTQNHFKMNADIKYDNLPNRGLSTEEISVSNLTIDSAGTVSIEGANNLGAITLQDAKTGKFNGFPITIETFKIFSSSEYQIEIDGTIVMTDDLSNDGGTPFNASVSIARNGVGGGKDAIFELPSSGEIKIADIPLKFGNNSSKFNVKVKWFDDDPVYGKGFMAQTELEMKKPGVYKVQGKIMIGKTDNGNGFAYWFVEAGVEFGRPIPIAFYDIGVKGFTGRVYSKMKHSGKGITASDYVPDKDSKFGVYAKVPICSFTDHGVKFWGYTDLEVTVGAGFTCVLHGKLYFLSKRYGDRDARITGEATISVSTNPLLFETEVNVNADFWRALCGQGNLKIHISEDDWYMKLGSRNNPITLDYMCGLGGYFGYFEILKTRSTLGFGYRFDTGEQRWGYGVGFFGRAWGSISFLGDVVYSPLQVFASATLNGNARIGAYIDMSVWSGTLTLLEGTVTANLQATFPDPFCFAGSIYARACIDPCPVFSCEICESTTMGIRYKNGNFELKTTCNE